MRIISDFQKPQTLVDDPLDVAEAKDAGSVVKTDHAGEDSSKPGETRNSEDASNEFDHEEGTAAYRLGGFHPVYIGDIYNEKYTILRKIGYGRYSTVWLVRDLTQIKGDQHEFRAMKVLSAECYNQEAPIYEREILMHLRETDNSHAGHKYTCHLVDDFEHKGANGVHVCLVFELMGETLDSFRVWFAKHMLPNVLMRKFTGQLLMALDYVHDCGIIHTDIKPDNIYG